MSDLIGLDSLHLLIGLALSDTDDSAAAAAAAAVIVAGAGNACASFVAHVICISYACANV